jgi:hypothetical protein
MKDLILHETTERQIDDFIAAPSHAVLLLGAIGSGKIAIANGLAEIILDPPGRIENYPYKLSLTGEKGSIGIEAVRQLEGFLSLKVPREQNINRVVIIEDAQNLTLEAQNALLKTLEEPADKTLLILTASHAQALLPTITSRVQAIHVKRPPHAEVSGYFKAKGYDEASIKQAYAISGGLPGLMTALLGQSDHPLMAATEQARQWLQASTYERLLLTDELAKQRDLALNMAFILQQMAHVSLQTATNQGARRWQAILQASFDFYKEINQNAQPKLALTNLALAF